MTNEKEEHSWAGKVSSKAVALTPLPSMPQSGSSVNSQWSSGPLWASRLCGLQGRICFSGIRGKKQDPNPYSFSLAYPWALMVLHRLSRLRSDSLNLIFWKCHFASCYQEATPVCWKGRLTKGCDRIYDRPHVCHMYLHSMCLLLLLLPLKIGTCEIMSLAQSSERSGREGCTVGSHKVVPQVPTH